MPFTASCRCAYLSADYGGVPAHVWAAYKYVKALKGKDIKGYAYVPVRDGYKRLEQSTRGNAPRWFGIHGADMLEGAVAPPYSLVPIPSSVAAVDSNIVFGTQSLAEAIETAVDSQGVTVLDAIRWDEPLQPAHEGGPRFAHQVYPHVRIVADMPRGTRIVLVDDVMTSGGHLQAVAAKLRRKGAEVVYAVCGARTVYEPADDSWAIVTETLADYEP